MSEDPTKGLHGDDLIRFLIADLKLTTGRRLETLRADMHQELRVLTNWAKVLEEKVDRTLLEAPNGESVQPTLAVIQTTLRRFERQIDELGLDMLRG